jgi:hypothetical protein
MYGGEKNYTFLVGNPKKRAPLGRHKRRWEDGIKIDHIRDGMVLVEFTWLRLRTRSGFW